MTLNITADLSEVNIFPATELEEIAQNVRCIISTVKGTVPLYREFGISAPVIDMPIAASRAKLTGEIVAAVAKYEPRAKVARVMYGDRELDGILDITVQIEINERELRGGVFLNDG